MYLLKYFFRGLLVEIEFHEDEIGAVHKDPLCSNTWLKRELPTWKEHAEYDLIYNVQRMEAEMSQ